jgi:hypothetical protein
MRDDMRPSGTACDTLPLRRPRRDGPGLDVKALACVADFESRN